MEFSPHVVIPLLIWGTLVGLDLVSVPQAMISRPLVAGAVAGAFAGDMVAAFGLVLAVLGGWTLQVVRRWNARAIQRRAAALAAGESDAIRWLQYGGIARDALRGFTLTLAGLVLASTISESIRLDRQTAVAFTLVAIGSAMAAAVSSAFRGAGRGARLKWLIAGLAVGIVIAVVA